MKYFIALVGIASCSLLEVPTCAGGGPNWVVGWGDNTIGETGRPFIAQYVSNGPVAVTGRFYSNVIAVSAGASHSLALSPDGTVFGWGGNEMGEAAGFKTDYPYLQLGKVEVAGKVLDNVTAISAGDWYSLALKRDGTVVSWGKGRENNDRNQVDVPPGLSNVIAIAAGANCSVALRNDGSVVGWGDRMPPAGLSNNIVAIAVGRGDFSPCLALTSDHKVIEWTHNVERRDPVYITPIPAEATNVIAIAAGTGHRLALRKDGTIVGWGRNRDGQATGVRTLPFPSESYGVVRLGGQVLNNVVAIAASADFSLALKGDGTVVAWGDNGSHQTEVPVWLSNVVSITAGDHFCLAITTNSAVAERFRP